MTTAPHPTLEAYVATDAERQPFVTDLFDRSAPYYDRVCAAMSFGSGVRYRRDALSRAGLADGMRVLDVATGTGLVAGAARALVGKRGAVIGADPSAGMLREAAKADGARLVQAFGESLPFRDAHFDFVSMGYALRHVSQLEAVFAEYRRVLKPGGCVLLLEITRPESRAAHWAARIYFRQFVPLMTRVLTWSPASVRLMQYYWDTIEACVPPAMILDALRGAVFANVERRIVHGIFSEYIGRRPA